MEWEGWLESSRVRADGGEMVCKTGKPRSGNERSRTLLQLQPLTIPVPDQHRAQLPHIWGQWRKVHPSCGIVCITTAQRHASVLCFLFHSARQDCVGSAAAKYLMSYVVILTTHISLTFWNRELMAILSKQTLNGDSWVLDLWGSHCRYRNTESPRCTPETRKECYTGKVHNMLTQEFSQFRKLFRVDMNSELPDNHGNMDNQRERNGRTYMLVMKCILKECEGTILYRLKHQKYFFARRHTQAGLEVGREKMVRHSWKSIITGHYGASVFLKSNLARFNKLYKKVHSL